VHRWGVDREREEMAQASLQIACVEDRILSDAGLRADLAARGREVAKALPNGRDTATRWLERYAETLLMT